MKSSTEQHDQKLEWKKKETGDATKMQADARARSCANNVWCSTEVASHLCLQSYGLLRWRMRSTLTFASVYIKQMVKIPLINRRKIKSDCMKNAHVQNQRNIVVILI